MINAAITSALRRSAKRHTTNTVEDKTMHRVPEVEISRLYADATARIDAHYFIVEMLKFARPLEGILVYVDDSVVTGRRRIVWRFKFNSDANAKKFDSEFG